MSNPQLVTGRTRAGRDGKEIECPHCHTKIRLYHFAWYARRCEGCAVMVPKVEWLICPTTP